jgi:very-short-patch-repair endonuclease
MTANARSLRRNATDAERALWRVLSPYRPRFTRQHVIGGYIVDLACREVRLAIELDGSQHIGSVADEERTRDLEALGWRVMRFWNSDVLANCDGVAEAILAEVSACLGETHPRPLPVSREGRIRSPRS